MKKITKVKQRDVASIRKGWTKKDQAERRFVAQLKQQWLYDTVGFGTLCSDRKRPALALAKAN